MDDQLLGTFMVEALKEQRPRLVALLDRLLAQDESPDKIKAAAEAMVVRQTGVKDASELNSWDAFLLESIKVYIDRVAK